MTPAQRQLVDRALVRLRNAMADLLQAKTHDESNALADLIRRLEKLR